MSSNMASVLIQHCAPVVRNETEVRRRRVSIDEGVPIRYTDEPKLPIYVIAH